MTDVHYEDQMLAADRETSHVLVRLAEELQRPLYTTRTDEKQDRIKWLPIEDIAKLPHPAAPIRKFFERSAAREVTCCPHLQGPSFAQPSFVVLWERPKPVVRCKGCYNRVVLAQPPLSEDEKWRCDVCGTVKVGDCGNWVTQYAHIMFFGGACSSCVEAQKSGRPWKKVGRNDPCLCGSGVKSKKCCRK